MMVPSVVSLSYANYAVSACVGGLFTLAGMFDLGSLASYLVYVRQSAMPLNQFTSQVNFLLAALSGAERIFEMMEEPVEIDDGEVTLCNVNVHDDGSMDVASGYTGDFAWKVPGEPPLMILCWPKARCLPGMGVCLCRCAAGLILKM